MNLCRWFTHTLSFPLVKQCILSQENHQHILGHILIYISAALLQHKSTFCSWSEIWRSLLSSWCDRTFTQGPLNFAKWHELLVENVILNVDSKAGHKSDAVSVPTDNTTAASVLHNRRVRAWPPPEPIPAATWVHNYWHYCYYYWSLKCLMRKEDHNAHSKSTERWWNSPVASGNQFMNMRTNMWEARQSGIYRPIAFL